jgi:hypothetical protein
MKDILKEFDEKFMERPYEEGIIYANGSEVKDFVSHALSQQKQEIIERIEKTKYYGADLVIKQDILRRIKE